ncbi:MAG: Maf family protein [Christensenellaceae bacterium]|nr:Maf family protein [Christensenellaceae bacterium]
MKVLLASNSPRRRELIKCVFEDVSTCSVDANEDFVGATPEETVNEIAKRKLEKAVECGFADGYGLIIASDTLVYCGGVYYGKPNAEKGAFEMLKELQGRTHTVYTSLAIKRGSNITVHCDSADVTFKPLTDGEIDEYLATHSVLDKAGAYAFQEEGATLATYLNAKNEEHYGTHPLITKTLGDVTTIVGLPVKLLRAIAQNIV